VDYGGSSGYGRDYRERLRGKWGIVDVEDCTTAVRVLGERKMIDITKTAIRGGSAGGYTVLQALATSSNVFHAGTSLYGISDLFKLAEDTHKFESRYLEKLLGGTPEEVPDTYQERSPVYHAENINTSLLILQGSVDAVVPPNQAEAIMQKIQEKGGKVEYILFEGEGHGWKKAENIKRALEAELAFYETTFGLRSA
jgi:dipeptidyl aminopeptidase/acylaminoacyl peptidase